jgi:CheY-like chemotaxis protein
VNQQTVPTILVVEPAPVTKQMLKLTLEQAGYRVVEANDGDSALIEATEHAPDLVLLDLHIADMSGRRLARHLRRLPGCGQLPIVGLSDHPSLLNHTRDTNDSFAGFLARPFLPSQLVRTIAVYLWPKALPNMDVPQQEFRILVVEDNDAERERVAGRLREQGFLVATASDGCEALKMALKYPPDALVCDTTLPGCDGFELTLTLRRFQHLANIPVILSPGGHIEELDHSMAMSVGADACVPRSADLKEITRSLVDTIKKRKTDIIALAKSQQQAAEPLMLAAV